jgi:hypothetical protein
MSLIIDKEEFGMEKHNRARIKEHFARRWPIWKGAMRALAVAVLCMPLVYSLSPRLATGPCQRDRKRQSN